MSSQSPVQVSGSVTEPEQRAEGSKEETIKSGKIFYKWHLNFGRINAIQRKTEAVPIGGCNVNRISESGKGEVCPEHAKCPGWPQQKEKDKRE